MADDTNTAERDAFKAAHQHLDLVERPDAWGSPVFRASHVEASWRGWLARASLAASAWREPVTFELPPTPFEPFAQGVEIGYDLWGGADIRLGGEFVYVHINYDYRYTHNAARRSLAEQIAGIIAGTLFTHPSPPEGMAGWRPIETAPEKGVFLVYMPTADRDGDRIQVAVWHPNVKVVGNLFAFDCAPITHWMPLPAPPIPASEAKEL